MPLRVLLSGSDCLGEFVECGRDATMSVAVYCEFVVASVEVLYES